MIDENIIQIAGIRVTPDQISKEGVWTGEEGMSCDVKDMTFSVPKNAAQQSVMAILEALPVYSVCPNCHMKTSKDGLIMMLEEYHIYVAKCCNNLIWLKNGGKEFEERMA